MTTPHFTNIRAVLFDLDGTLYSQRALRMRIVPEILAYYALHPTRLNEMRILSTFRNERERHAGTRLSGLDTAQYQWTADRLGIPPTDVSAVVTRWIYEAPLKYLSACKPRTLDQCLHTLKANGIKIGVCSDYPAPAKLAALNIQVDTAWSAVDASVSALKPDPTVFLRAAEALGVPPDACVVVGDRSDRDGTAAASAHMQFLRAEATSEFYTDLAQRFS